MRYLMDSKVAPVDWPQEWPFPPPPWPPGWPRPIISDVRLEMTVTAPHPFGVSVRVLDAKWGDDTDVLKGQLLRVCGIYGHEFVRLRKALVDGKPGEKEGPWNECAIFPVEQTMPGRWGFGQKVLTFEYPRYEQMQTFEIRVDVWGYENGPRSEQLVQVR